MKKKVAIIGTGISGLSIAYFLSNKYDIEVFEKNNYIGGHTNTVEVEEEGRQIPIDTGFIVFNYVTYPNLCKLFDKLQVPVKKSNMSFSVQNEFNGLEFCGSGLNGLFIQRKNLFSIPYIKFLLEINRFNKESIEILNKPEYEQISLGTYLKEKKFSQDMMDNYLIPMSSAVWSTPPDLMLSFPARTLVRFFYNHGFLGLNTQHQWYTIEGGSREYVKKVIKPFQEKIYLNQTIEYVYEENGKVYIEGPGMGKKSYDKVILATHGDQSLKILKKPSPLQKEVLKEFRYQPNTATLHTWDGDMPRKKGAWSSWNYKYIKTTKGLVPFTIYWMNKLQGVSKKKNYFVTINDPGRIPSEHIIQTILYEHPVFLTGSIQAQQRFQELNKEGNIHFTGAYFRYGFHEDGIDASVRLYEILEGENPWEKMN